MTSQVHAELSGHMQALVPAATALAWAVRTGDDAEVRAALAEAEELCGDDGVRVFAVLLAALVPDDEAPSELLGWLTDPTGYVRLRDQGLSRKDATETVRLRNDHAARDL